MPWEFPSSLAFSRINSFFRRVQTIEVKVEFGSPPSGELRLLSLSSLHMGSQEGNKSHPNIYVTAFPG